MFSGSISLEWVSTQSVFRRFPQFYWSLRRFIHLMDDEERSFVQSQGLSHYVGFPLGTNGYFAGLTRKLLQHSTAFRGWRVQSHSLRQRPEGLSRHSRQDRPRNASVVRFSHYPSENCESTGSRLCLGRVRMKRITKIADAERRCSFPRSDRALIPRSGVS